MSSEILKGDWTLAIEIAPPPIAPKLTIVSRKVQWISKKFSANETLILLVLIYSISFKTLFVRPSACVCFFFCLSECKAVKLMCFFREINNE